MLKKWTAALLVLLLTSVMFLPMALAVERYEILMVGDKDEYVLELQQALYDQGYLKVKPTGYFGTDTQAAVIQFQKDKGLSVDGKAGPQVREALFGKNYKPIPASRLKESTTPSKTTTLQPGDKGDLVTKVQRRLKELEYYTYDSYTGYYGPVTEEAVQKFQRTMGLDVTGTLDTDSYTLLFSKSAKAYVMCAGDSGDDIKSMQQRLRALGYLKASATGYFGTQTLTAVKDFQKVNGLSVDGKVGQQTRTKLYSSSAVKKPGNADTTDDDTQGDVEPTGVDKLLDIAQKQLGKSYVYNTCGPTTFDCSGFVYYCLKNAGVKVSRMGSIAYSQVSSWSNVENKSSLKKGDLVFFCSPDSSVISHVAIYMGSGKIIHAVPSEKAVVTSTLTGYWDTYYVSAKRVF